MEDKTEYQVQITLMDLLQSQLGKLATGVEQVTETMDEML